MLAGVAYWAGWRILLPKMFGYELVQRKETLDDGTVVTLVRAHVLRRSLIHETETGLLCHPVFAPESSVK